MHVIATAALAALPLVTAITPPGMISAPRRAVALANPSGVSQPPPLIFRHDHVTDGDRRILPSTPRQNTPSKIKRPQQSGNDLT